MRKELSLVSGETRLPSACRPRGLDFRAEETAVSEPKARRGRGGAGVVCAPCPPSSLLPYMINHP